MFSFRRFLTIIKKEFIQIKRDPISLRIPIAMPILFMLLFGYAVNTEVDHLKTAIVDLNQTAESRNFAKAFTSSLYFDITETVTTEAALVKLIESGAVRAGILIPANFSRNLAKGESTDIGIVIDGTDPTSARTAYTSAIMVAENYSRTARIGGSIAPTLVKQAIKVGVRVLYNPDLETKRFTIPGLVGLILQNLTIILTAFALVREKERGTIEQLIVTPIRPAELIIGKIIPYILIGYAGFLFALAISMFWFGVWPIGSIPLLLGLGLLFVICSLLIGLLISTLAKTQFEAMLVSIVIILPSILLSGFVFPLEAAHPIIRAFGYFIPLTYFLDIIRGIVLKGVGLELLWKDALILFGFTSILLISTIARFRKSLD